MYIVLWCGLKTKARFGWLGWRLAWKWTGCILTDKRPTQALTVQEKSHVPEGVVWQNRRLSTCRRCTPCRGAAGHSRSDSETGLSRRFAASPAGGWRHLGRWSESDAVVRCRRQRSLSPAINNTFTLYSRPSATMHFKYIYLRHSVKSFIRLTRKLS